MIRGGDIWDMSSNWTSKLSAIFAAHEKLENNEFGFMPGWKYTNDFA